MKLRNDQCSKPTVIKVIALICPNVFVRDGKFAAYDVKTKTIEVPCQNDNGLLHLVEAVHETFHALRHQQGHPFYKALEAFNSEDLLNVKERQNRWNEEAVEESRVNACTKIWCLENLDFPKERITSIIDTLQKEAIKPDKGFVSKYRR